MKLVWPVNGWHRLALVFPHLLAISGLVVSAWAQQVDERIDLRSHYVAADRQGRPADLNGEKLSTSDLKSHIKMIKDGIDSYARCIGGKEPLRLLFFVHGGLNTRRDQLERAEALLRPSKNCQQLSVLTESSYYPVFINWEAAYWSALRDDLFFVRQGKDNPWLGIPTFPFVLATRMGEGVLSVPSELYYVGENFGETFREDSRTWYERALGGITNVVLFPVRFLTIPLISAFGSPAWEMLKRQTDFTLKREKGDQGVLSILMDELKCPFSQVDKENASESQKTKCLCRQGEELKWIRADDPKEVSVQITLVGHSMGTLVLDGLLSAALEVPFRHIIYLASASSIEDMVFSVYPYLEMHDQSKFWSFMLSKGDEAKDDLFGPLFEGGSLLVWIDSFLERVYRPDQLRFGRARNLGDYKKPEDLKKRITIKKFDGYEGEPKSHIDFGKYHTLTRILCAVDREAFSDDCNHYNVD